jgi:peroxiredoxin
MSPETHTPPRIGDIAPDFELPDSQGVPQKLADLVAAGPRIFIFYRGHW